MALCESWQSGRPAVWTGAVPQGLSLGAEVLEPPLPAHNPVLWTAWEDETQ